MADFESYQRARKFRAALTPPEARLWSALKGQKRRGRRFRRQHPIGPYILDFHCAAAKLAVEVDDKHISSQPNPNTMCVGRRGLRVGAFAL